MLHSNIGQNSFIWTKEPVYKGSPIGNLDGFMASNIILLQKGFQSNILACSPVGVDYNSAFLESEQGIVSTAMSLSNSTAVKAGTELACMPCINNAQHNAFAKIPMLGALPKSKERNSHNFTIGSLAFRIETFKILDGDIGIIMKGHFCNISNNLAYSVLDKVMLVSFGPLKCLLGIFAPTISITLQNRFSLKNLLSLNPNVLSKVVLKQNFAFWRNHSSKTFAVRINHTCEVI
ncbi:MAG: hypothetical protein QXN59_02805 [Candidatus Micrarchaeaceae archaeon]